MTIVLRLFKASEPARQLDSRTLEAGDLSIGRDAGQAWVLDDPGRLISRAHLLVSLKGDAVTVTDTSSNGVFIGEGEERLPQARATPVEPGASLRFGPYLLLIERAAAGRAPSPGRDAFAGPASPSPFTPAGVAPGRGELRAAARPDPFASELAPDPFGFALNPDRPESRPGGRPAAPPPTSGEDAWSRPRERRAGDWDAPSPKREGHENLIGSGRSWTTPPPAPPPEVGFGFDAPFSQPILRQVEVSGADLAIPSDWDAPSPAPAWPAEPPPIARAAPPPVAEPVPEPPAPIVSTPGPELERETAPAWAPTEPPALSSPAAPPAVELQGSPPSPWDAPPLAAVPAAPPPRASEAIAAPAVPPAAVHAATSPPIDAADRAMVEAFCRGAGLDPEALARLEPAEAMARAGAVYRQMILGMSDLMGERTSLKNEYRMVRTTVRAENNNPFKWLPPQAVATQLLLQPGDGFLGGPEAVSDAFRDLKKHLLCLLAGLRAALASTLDALAPARVEEAIKGQTTLMKGRGAAAWSEYARLHAAFRKDADDNPDSPVNREFRAAYERQLTELDRMGPG